MRPLRPLAASLALILSLACGGVPAPSAMPTPSPAALALAAQLGIPAVVPGTGVAGPFDGPQGSLYYLDQAGHITFFLPQNLTVYAGEAASGQLRYAFSPTGFYAIQGAQVVPISGPPPELAAWPQVDPLAQVLLQVAQQQLQQQQLLHGSSGGEDWATMSAVSRSLHETNMAILDNMGSAGCTDHYEDYVYVGCW